MQAILHSPFSIFQFTLLLSHHPEPNDGWGSYDLRQFWSSPPPELASVEHCLRATDISRRPVALSICPHRREAAVRTDRESAFLGSQGSCQTTSHRGKLGGGRLPPSRRCRRLRLGGKRRLHGQVSNRGLHPYEYTGLFPWQPLAD